MSLLGDAGAGFATGGLYNVAKAGGLFKGVSAPDISGLINTINQSAAKQTATAQGIVPGGAALGNTFQSGINSAEGVAQKSAADRSKQFLDEISGQNGEQTALLKKSLNQNIYSGLPQQREAMKEALAATGGLQRGAAGAALGGLEQETAGKVAEGDTQIDLQQNQMRTNALNAAYNVDEGLIQQKLGIDQSTLAAIYSTGNADLIAEINAELGIDQTQTQQLLDAQQFALSGGMASQAAGQTSRNQLIQSLIGTGGMMLGARATGSPIPVTSPTAPSYNPYNDNSSLGMLRNSLLTR